MRALGRTLFDGVLLFVLTLSLLVSPALAANAISGDRAGGTLAITQVTLLRTGHLMTGKWLAAWIASAAFLAAALPWLAVAAVVGRVSPWAVLVGLVMILVEFGMIAGIGVAVSAIAGRTLFAVVVTYLIVAALTIGTLVAFGLSLQFLQTEVRANDAEYGSMTAEPFTEAELEKMTPEEADQAWAEWEAANPELFDGIADRCVGPVTTRTIPDPRRSGWLLAANPYAVLADASPWEAGLLADGIRPGRRVPRRRAARSRQHRRAGPAGHLAGVAARSGDAGCAGGRAELVGPPSPGHPGRAAARRHARGLSRAGVGRGLLDTGRCQPLTRRRPSKARPRVTSSAYSRSPPTGRPEARRVTRMPVAPRRRPR